jgi:hypothetical protein
MKSMARFLTLILALALSVSATAWGQYQSTYGYSFNNPISATCNSLAWSNMNARLTYRTILKRHGYTDAQLGQMSTDQMMAAMGGAKSAKAEAKKPVQGAATSFRRARGYLLLPAMARSLVKDPEQQKALLEVFDQGMKEYEKQAEPQGLKNDVAGAMVFLIASSYYVFNDGLEPDSDGTDILIRVLQQNLDTDEFRGIADADKQKFYELMIGLATYIGATYEMAKAENDAELADTLKAAAGDALKGFLKFDPATVRFTPNGLEVSSAKR